jgi:hypothetical protein
MFARTRRTWMKVVIIVLVLGSGLGVPAYGFAGGTGEPNDPYQIATVADLLSIGSDLNLPKKSFVLINDLDLDPTLPGGRVFDNALIVPEFAGVFDGQGHAIHHLCIAAPATRNAGLFNRVHGLIRDLHLKDVQVSGSSCGALAIFISGGVVLQCSATGKVTGTSAVGGLVGNAWDGKVLSCESRVDVTGSSDVGGLVGNAIPGALIAQSRAGGVITGGKSVGGLIGHSSGAAILNCTTDCQVTGSDQVGGLAGDIFQTVISHGDAQTELTAVSKAGGLVGSSSTQSQMADCRAAGTVTADDLAGGLVGSGRDVAIRGCAAACNVSAKQTAGGLLGDGGSGLSVVDCCVRGSLAGSVLGGLIGADGGSLGFPTYLLNSYAACELLGLMDGAKAAVVGGLVGNRKSPDQGLLASACFWDIELAKVTVGVGSTPVYGGTGLTTNQMQQPDAFRQAGWDFDSTWAMGEEGYPVLRWELAPSENLPADTETGPSQP